MTKFCGEVGFTSTVNTSPGVWEEKIITRKYRGEILQASLRHQNGVSLNEDLTTSNSVSIIADEFAYEHCYEIRYVKWGAVSWSVNTIEIKQHPRITLYLGGVYNEPSIGIESDTI